MEIIPRPRAELKPDPANPRRHSKKQIQQIAESIRAFGFNVPILVDRDGHVIAGHGRLLACRELGIDEVPTLCLEHLTPAQARAFRIADNKLTENATWDDRLLAEQLRDLSLSGLDFDIEVTGFEMGEIDLRIASLEDTPAAGSDPADILPEASVAPLVSKLGYLWLSEAYWRSRETYASRIRERFAQVPGRPRETARRLGGSTGRSGDRDSKKACSCK